MTTPEQFYLLGGEPRERSRFRLTAARLRKRSEIHEAIRQARKQSSSVWIATKPGSTDDLLREAFAEPARASGRPQLGRLLMLFPPRPASLPALQELFSPVAWGTDALKLLPYDELAEVLTAENRRDLFIGGFADPRTDTLILYRGDFERLAVPMAIFQPTVQGAKPDVAALSVADYGQTVALGPYEAASDAILYEVDPEYRRRANARRREEDRSFGACFRRLRILKGLRQSDFNSLPAKTIARIERGETGKPHRDTLQKIARRLGVDADQIETY